jgi:hypothetical protein
MYKLLARIAALVVACAVIVPSIAYAADVSAAQRTSIENAGQQLFRAVVDGNAKGVLAITTPSFKLKTLEDQTLTANDLVSKWQIMMIEYGGVHGTTKLDSVSTDGNTVTAVYTVAAYADTATAGREGAMSSALNAVHQIVWIPSGNSWKAASDTVLRQTSNFHGVPSL